VLLLLGGPDRLVQVRVVGTGGRRALLVGEIVGIYRLAGNSLAQVDHAGW